MKSLFHPIEIKIPLIATQRRHLPREGKKSHVCGKKGVKGGNKKCLEEKKRGMKRSHLMGQGSPRVRYNQKMTRI